MLAGQKSFCCVGQRPNWQSFAFLPPSRLFVDIKLCNWAHSKAECLYFKHKNCQTYN